MKKQLLFLLSSFAFILLTFSAEAQSAINDAQEAKMDKNPVYEQFNDKCILDRVEYQEERTIFHFRYKASSYTSVFLYSPEGDYPWFLKDKTNGEEYDLLGVYNVRRNNKKTYDEVTGNYAYMSADPEKEKTYFECEVHFERLPEHVAEVDLIEGKGMEEAWNHFHCFDIKVTPLKEKKDAMELVIAAIQPQDVVIVPNVDLFVEAIAPVKELTPITATNAVANDNSSSGATSSLITVTENVNWSVFPTPATSVLNIKQTEAQNAQLTLISLSGQTIWTGQIQGTVKSIDISALPSGAYILQHTSNGATTAQKVLKK
jgi:hypothetical protein